MGRLTNQKSTLLRNSRKSETKTAEKVLAPKPHLIPVISSCSGAAVSAVLAIACIIVMVSSPLGKLTLYPIIFFLTDRPLGGPIDRGTNS